jgi:protein phosphatase
VTLWLPEGVQVGAATHTGCLRDGNEDDYLVLTPGGTGEGSTLLVVADGMGGVGGGGEASRTAVRTLASAYALPDGEGGDRQRMQAGFQAACRAVYDAARRSPALRAMGTTLTALHLRGGRATIGHVGDSRCLRLRGGQLETLTTDHAVQEAGSRLTRCVGGGRETEVVDLLEIECGTGDQFVLATDGLWGVVPPSQVQGALRAPSAQAAAEELVRAAVRAGGPDNCTAVVLRLIPDGGPTRVEIPRSELRLGPTPLRRARSLRRARWPWLLLAAAVLAAGAAIVELVGGPGTLPRFW